MEFMSDCLGLPLCAGVTVEDGKDLSDVGGDGGVCVSEAAEETDFVGGVATVGEGGVVPIGECSDAAVRGLGRVTAGGRCARSAMASAFRSFSCLISASTFRSDSSSRNL